MKFNNFCRAKKIIGTYIDALSYFDDSFKKTELVLKEACPNLLKGKSVIESARICSTAFDLINFVEWNNGHYLVPLIKIKLTTINLIYVLSSNKSTTLSQPLATLVTQSLLNTLNQFKIQPNQEESMAMELCLCAFTTACRENLDSNSQPTRGPNTHHYNLQKKISYSPQEYRNLYFSPKENAISKKEHQNIIKEKIIQLLQAYEQLILKIEQNSHRRTKYINSPQIAQFELEIEKLKYYIVEHQIFLNPRTQASLNRLEHLAEQGLLHIAHQQEPHATPPN